ncbi:MAG: hypothetical protein AVDCRST_MAG35-2760, partial [uncultured Quadrisphaera sp.]
WTTTPSPRPVSQPGSSGSPRRSTAARGGPGTRRPSPAAPVSSPRRSAS